MGLTYAHRLSDHVLIFLWLDSDDSDTPLDANVIFRPKLLTGKKTLVHFDNIRIGFFPGKPATA